MLVEGANDSLSTFTAGFSSAFADSLAASLLAQLLPSSNSARAGVANVIVFITVYALLFYFSVTEVNHERDLMEIFHP
jgi:hypothetical protein